jgi:hypothetical protein
MNAIEQARAAGITEVETFAGWTPLDKWTPYGKRPQDARFITFHYDAERRQFRETRNAELAHLVPQDDTVLGIWLAR